MHAFGGSGVAFLGNGLLVFFSSCCNFHDILHYVLLCNLLERDQGAYDFISKCEAMLLFGSSYGIWSSAIRMSHAMKEL